MTGYISHSLGLQRVQNFKAILFHLKNIFKRNLVLSRLKTKPATLYCLLNSKDFLSKIMFLV